MNNLPEVDLLRYRSFDNPEFKTQNSKLKTQNLFKVQPETTVE